MLIRAIEPEEVSDTRPPGAAIKPTATTAASATTAATTRQKVSLRRILRRSTITSESSDIEILLKNISRGLQRQRDDQLGPIPSIAMQFEENKALRRPGER